MAPQRVTISLHLWHILVQFDAQSHPESSKVTTWLQQAGKAPDLLEHARLPSDPSLLELPIVRALKNCAHYGSIFSKRAGTASREITGHYWTSIFLFVDLKISQNFKGIVDVFVHWNALLWFWMCLIKRDDLISRPSSVSSRLLGSSSLFIIFPQSNWKSVYIQVNILPKGHLQTFRPFIIMLPFTGWTYKADLLDR